MPFSDFLKVHVGGPKNVSIASCCACFKLLLLLLYVGAYQVVSLHLFLANWFLQDQIKDVVESAKRILRSLFWFAVYRVIKQNNLRIIITGDNLELADNLNCIISNHRSLVDYALIFYLAAISQSSAIGSQDTLADNIPLFSKLLEQQLGFLSWGRIWFIPTLRNCWDVLHNDENWSLTSSQLINQIKASGTRTVVLFPEVNIITEANQVIGNKLAHDYCLPQLNNLLYPRFDNFISLTSSGACSMYDLTIVYYKPILETFNECPINNDKLQMITPSIWDLFVNKPSRFIVRVNIQKKRIDKLPKKPARIESWLEHSWREKDKIIDLMERSISLA